MSLPKLAVLDDYAQIAPRHLDQFSQQVDITYFPDTLNPDDPAQFEKLVKRLEPFELISTMRERTPFSRKLIESLPRLKVLFTTGPRNGGIDVRACADRGIPVVGTSGMPEDRSKLRILLQHDTTNEQTWALILGMAKGVAERDSRLRSDSNSWQSSSSSASSSSLALPLAGKTLGLLGLGRLGLQCAVTGKLGFGMDILAWSPNLTQEKADESAKSRGLAAGSIKVASSKEELLQNADVLSLHLVLSERSKDILGADELASMKKSAYIVNTSRGPLINEAALLQTLKKGKIYGYAADVFNTEPLPKDSEWRSSDWGKEGKSHVLLSPHMGYVTENILSDMYKHTADNVRAWLNNEEFATVIKPS